MNWTELRRGLARARPYLLSHHEPAASDRCYLASVRGHRVRLCARCSGIYPGLLLGIAAQLWDVGPLVHPLLFAVLPLPAILDWGLDALTARDGTNPGRTATGLLLGYGYALGLTHAIDGNVLVLLVGVAYGVLGASVLLAAGNGAENGRRHRARPFRFPANRPTDTYGADVSVPHTMTHCTNCGAEIAADADVCPECGVNQSTRLESGYGDRGENEKYCVDCGELIFQQAEYCPECDAEQPSLGGSPGDLDDDQVAAGLLAVLLGSFGVHKFYQGNTRNGVLYLCLFWSGIPGLLGIIEGILMLMADEDVYWEKWADGSILGR